MKFTFNQILIAMEELLPISLKIFPMQLKSEMFSADSFSDHPILNCYYFAM